ncbi:hotdog fold thioesterase [Aliikangiella sp. IMCC44653]
MIWKKDFSLEQLNMSRANTLVELLNIQLTEFGEDYLVAKMPVNSKTHQPMGILHGGASIVLAESVGSIAANLAVDESHYCVGLEVNGNHLRSIRSGWVLAKATAVHLGRSTQVWNIMISCEKGKSICAARLTMAVLSKEKLSH